MNTDQDFHMRVPSGDDSHHDFSRRDTFLHAPLRDGSYRNISPQSSRHPVSRFHMYRCDASHEDFSHRGSFHEAFHLDAASSDNLLICAETVQKRSVPQQLQIITDQLKVIRTELQVRNCCALGEMGFFGFIKIF